MNKIKAYILSSIVALGFVTSSCEKDSLTPEQKQPNILNNLEYVIQIGDDTTTNTLNMITNTAYLQRERAPHIALFKASKYHLAPGDTITVGAVAYDHENDTVKFLFKASGGKLLRTTKRFHYDPARFPDLRGHVPQVSTIQWVAPIDSPKDTFRLGAFAFDKNRNGYDMNQLRVVIDR